MDGGGSLTSYLQPINNLIQMDGGGRGWLVTCSLLINSLKWMEEVEGSLVSCSLLISLLKWMEEVEAY